MIYARGHGVDEGSGSLIEIDESMLVRLAGARAFGRGLHCFEEGGVQDIVTTKTVTTALVEDERQHSVRLRHTHRMMEGECDCEVSDGIDFCQHCVAVALHLQERQMPARPIDKRSALRQIRRQLSELSQDELLNEFIETIKRDRALRDDLLQKVRLSSEGMSYAELQRSIPAAMRLKGRIPQMLIKRRSASYWRSWQRA